MPSQRITLWGNSGSGKSTLAELAGAKLGLPVFHLDLIAWERDWRYRDEPGFLALQRPWLDRPSWMIEGVGGWQGLIERFRRADLDNRGSLSRPQAAVAFPMVARNFDRVDHDGDGRLSSDEILDALAVMKHFQNGRR